VGGLEPGDHLPGLDLLQQLLQVPVKNDEILLHDLPDLPFVQGIYTAIPVRGRDEAGAS
jgi:hypothetical protein